MQIMQLSQYTTPGTGPLSWAATNANVRKMSDNEFRKHTSSYYNLDKKEGIFSKIAKAFRGRKRRPRGSWGLRVGRRGDASQRPGFLRGIGEEKGIEKSHLLLLGIIAAILYFYPMLKKDSSKKTDWDKKRKVYDEFGSSGGFGDLAKKLRDN